MDEFEFNEKLMGCEFDISLISDSREKAEKHFKEVFDLGKRYENIFSRFLQNSELSELNEKKCLKVSDVFWKTFREAEKLHKKSDGKFNPLVDIARFGYGKDFVLLFKSNIVIDLENYSSDFSRIKTFSTEKKIILDKNQKIDMGGFLKGYLSEIIADILKNNFSGVIVNIGGDLSTRGRDQNNNIFEFSLWNPVSETEINKILLENLSMSTSGNYKRKWKNAGKEVHHILESEGVGNPETDLVSATVISKDGGEADAFATALMTLSSYDAKKFCMKKKLNFILITKNSKIIKHI